MVEDGYKIAGAQDHDKLSGEISTDLSTIVKDTENSAPGCFSMSSWLTSSTSEEESPSASPIHMSFFPEYRSPGRSVRTLARCEDIYSLLVNHPPRKAVPVGPDHQVGVPPWVEQHTSNIASPSHPSNEVSKSEDEYQKRLMGTCVIPMPDLTSPAYTDTKVGSGRTDCNCEDGHSFRCIRKHIKEAREELLKTIGPERFTQLGFFDMGEDVAQCWSEEEEHAFHHVVFSNPAALGKNFWEKLSAVFPFRTKKEIVSYYFNVFMLRKRADQNRYDPTNIDSDNDEWQGSEDFGDNEIGMTEEDDDSVVESPVYGDYTVNIQNREDDLHEFNDIADGTCDDTNLDSNGGCVNQISETHPEKINNYSSNHGDQEVQDDSCTSFDAGPASHRIQSVTENGKSCNFNGSRNHMVTENGDHCASSFNGLITGGDNGYVLEPCYAKDWDVGFTTCSKNKVDFLPTCNMMEEVFGEEMRNYKVRDGKNLS